MILFYLTVSVRHDSLTVTASRHAQYPSTEAKWNSAINHSSRTPVLSPRWLVWKGPTDRKVFFLNFSANLSASLWKKKTVSLLHWTKWKESFPVPHLTTHLSYSHYDCYLVTIIPVFYHPAFGHQENMCLIVTAYMYTTVRNTKHLIIYNDLFCP